MVIRWRSTVTRLGKVGEGASCESIGTIWSSQVSDACAAGDTIVDPLHQARNKLLNFWKKDTIQEEVNFHVLHSCLEQDQLQRRQQKWVDSTPTCDFGTKNVKEESHDMVGASFHISTTQSLLGSLDPYWESQLLVEYSKDLFTCKCLVSI